MKTQPSQAERLGRKVVGYCAITGIVLFAVTAGGLAYLLGALKDSVFGPYETKDIPPATKNAPPD